MHAIIHWAESGDWRLTFEGVASFLTAVVALVAAVIAYRAVMRQISAEKQARSEELKRDKYVMAAVLRSEVFSIWEVDLNALSSEMRKIPGSVGIPVVASNGITLPAVPNRYFPVFERCADKIGLLDRGTVSLLVQFYKRIGELLLAWDGYNRSSDGENFDRLYKIWKGLHGGYIELLKGLDAELAGDLKVGSA